MPAARGTGGRRSVLFLCTGNSARSQMAEGLLRRLAGEAIDVTSAGTAPKGVHPLAVTAMAELGIDISQQGSKPVEPLLGEAFDYVITLCDEANESCPVFPGAARRLHWSFPDPAAATGADTERLAAFRAARDGVAARLPELLVALERDA